MTVKSEPAAAPEVLDAAAESFLFEFLDTPAPSGFEGPAAESWRTRARTFCETVTGDGLGNSMATVNVGSRPRMVMVGHVDEIGLVVTKIDDKGFLRCTNVGGWDVAVLVGQRVRIITADGPIRGTIGRTAVHELDKDARGKIPKLSQLWIDIGAQDADDAKARVKVGDPAVLDVAPVRLNEHRVVSRALDDRLGSFTVLEALRVMASNGNGAGPEVVAVGSIGEEIGAAGAITAAYSLQPDVAVVVDVTTPGDTPGGTDIGELALGKGPIITRGATTSRRYVDLLIDTARDNGIPHQLRGMGIRTRTDADQLTRAGAGVPTVLLSIPGRYLHTPCEQADLRDVRATIDLLVAFAARLSENA